jgi:hypothetical protein
MKQLKTARLRVLLHLLLTIMLFASKANGAAVAEYVLGEAVDIDSGEKLYSEYHCLIDSELQQEVLYYNAMGFQIARKILDYQTGRTTPSFIQRNVLTKEEMSATVTMQSVSLTLAGKKNKSKVLDRKSGGDEIYPLVVDAGFDVFVQRNWENLLDANDVRFLFPLVTRLRLVELQLMPSSCSYKTQTEACFRLESSSWLFRMLIDPIELGYDRALRRLSRYRGLSNIEDENGNGTVVDIEYRYQNTPFEECQTNNSLL